MDLLERDAAYLAQRGVSITCAHSYGLRTASVEEVRRILGRSDVESAALLFPYPQYNGEAPLIRLRLHDPLITADGPVRYLQPKNTPIRPFITRTAWKYREGLQALVIPEGEAKGLAAEEAGLRAVAIPGCWGWVAPKTKPEDKRTLHPAFDAFRLKGRQIYLVPDSDVITNRKVRDAFLALAKELQGRGASPRMVIIPPAVDGAKVGLDDLLAHRGTEALGRFIDEAPVATPAAVTAFIKSQQLDRPLEFQWASDVKIEPVRWWWEDRIPVGMITLVVGPPGLGKTTCVLDRLARATRGQLPGEFFGTPINAIVCSTEDHRKSVLAPRLIAAGADLRRIGFMSGPAGGPFTLPDQLPALRVMRFQTDARAIFIDPLSATFGASVNTWRDADVRRALTPLKEIAEQESIVPLGVMHLNRRETTDVLTRITGAGAFGQAARSVLLVAKDPDDSASRLIGQAKLNVGKEGLSSSQFRMEERVVTADDGQPVRTSGVVWGKESFRRADELLVTETSQERSERQEAGEFLREFVTAPTLSTTVKERAMADNIAWRTVERAKADLNMQSVRYEGKGYWLPPGVTKEQGKEQLRHNTATPPLYGVLGGVGGDGKTQDYQGEKSVSPSSPPNPLVIKDPLPPDGSWTPAPLGSAAFASLPPVLQKAVEVFEGEHVEARKVTDE